MAPPQACWPKVLGRQATGSNLYNAMPMAQLIVDGEGRNRHNQQTTNSKDQAEEQQRQW
jgi:hypothetical protein